MNKHDSFKLFMIILYIKNRMKDSELGDEIKKYG